MSNFASFLLIILSALFAKPFISQNHSSSIENNYYSQGIHNRTAAEWEPALGTMIVWPLSIPHTLVAELAKDNHLYVLLEDESARKEAGMWFTVWNLNPDKVSFIYAPQGVDAWWTRDWGPSAVFTDEMKYKLADGKYIYSTPSTGISCNDSLRFLYYDKNNNIQLTQIDDDATVKVAKQLDYDVLDLPFNNTGGNVLTDGLGTAFSTCAIITENKYHGIEYKDFLKLNDSLLGFQNYHFISNFEYEGIQHIDCFMKLIDEETILVAEPPLNHPLHNIYDNIVTNELSKLKTHYGRNYKILRIKTARYSGEQLAAYTNSLILNKTVYVPIFNIYQDSLALRSWAEAMPGYKIKGFKFSLNDEPFVTEKLRKHYKKYGWNSGDALHCRTRAIWDPKMLFISVKKINDIVDPNQRNIIYTTIKDYSKQGLVKEKCELFWRIKGKNQWTSFPLSQTENEDHFFAEIPNQKSGALIEYYISAVSNSGNQESRPKTAPQGFYQYVVK